MGWLSTLGALLLAAVWVSIGLGAVWLLVALFDSLARFTGA
jgi:hypothetical protein